MALFTFLLPKAGKDYMCKLPRKISSMIRSVLILISILSLTTSLIAQEEDNYSDFQGLHHMLDASEMARLGESQIGFLPSQAPTGPIRNIAEFNRMEGVLVTYASGFGIPLSLIAEMSQDAKVWTIVSGNSQQNYVSTQYQNNGVNLSNCVFLQKPINSYWTRDYGPWFILDGNGEVGIVDFPYNRPRPYDNAIPGHMATEMGVNLFNMNLLHTGGNYMTDGMGVAASTDLVISENSSLSLAQINQLVDDYLGIHTYHLNDDPLGLYIEHIDCWGKFLDVDKILIGEVPMSDPRYADYEAVAAYYASHLSSYGNPYQVYRVYAPNGQPYTNSLILNEKVFVPVVNGSGSIWNDSAIARYEQAMPGYQIIPVSQYNSAPWQTTDALHCRTKGLADREILDIWHQPLTGQWAPQPQYVLTARIVAASGEGFILDSMYCDYRINGGGWNRLLLSPDTAHQWHCSIPAQAPGTVIEYVLHASDSSGRNESHPFIAYADPHSFSIQNIVSRTAERDEQYLHILPNPSTDWTFINFSTLRAGEVSIQLYSAEGKLVLQEHWPAIPAGKHQKRLNINHWKSGMYFVVLKVPGKTLRAKLIRG